MNESIKNVSLIVSTAAHQAGFSTQVVPQFRRINFPRRWGITTTFCMELAASMLKPELDALQNTLDKKQFKQVKSTKVNELAQALATQIVQYITQLPIEFDEVKAENGYLNFYYSNEHQALAVVREICFNADYYGQQARAESPTNTKLAAKIMVEFSQPNTHKLFHVGHLRNVVLGNALCNLLETVGFRVIRANYIGDIGTHVAKWLAMEEEPESEADIARIYERAANRYNDNIEFQQKVKSVLAQWTEDFYQLSSGAPASKLISAWQTSKKQSLDMFNRIYNLLGISFDIDYFESDVEISSKRLVEEFAGQQSDNPNYFIRLETEGDYKGCIIADLTDCNLGQVVLLRSDNTTMYLTKDLSLAIHKFERHKLDKSIYITAREQELHFKQLFAILDKLPVFGFINRCLHLPYDLVILPSGKMSSRDGNIVSFDEFYSAVRQEITQITAEKGVSRDQETTINALTDGVLKFTMLSVDSNNTITFDWDQALSFDGFSAPYIQYAYARTRSLVENFIPNPNGLELPENLHQTELALIDKMSVLPDLILECAGDILGEPVEKPRISPLARYSYELAVAFNEFYHACPVLKADVDTCTRTWRQHLVFCFRTVLKRVFTDILGIQLPEYM